MIKNDFNSSIRSSLGFLEKANVDDITINVSSLRINAKFNEVALDRHSTYEEIYRSALNLSYFNFKLNDYALFQYSWENENSWRLAYYPNPWLSGVPLAMLKLKDLHEYLIAGAINTEEFSELLATDFSYHNAIPMLRFEYSTEQYKPIIHPAAHFHIGAFGGDRWASQRKFSPLSFTMLIIRMYYPETWLPNSSFKDKSVENCWESELNRSIASDGVSTEFSEQEKTSFHFDAYR